MALKERIARELALVRERYGAVDTGPDGEWLILPEWDFPAGWNKESGRLLVVIPAAYPTIPPDNFFTDNDLRLADGTLPENSTVNQRQAGEFWLQFSYHAESGDWKPHAEIRCGHNLLTFLEAVSARLREGT